MTTPTRTDPEDVSAPADDTVSGGTDIVSDVSQGAGEGAPLPAPAVETAESDSSAEPAPPDAESTAPPDRPRPFQSLVDLLHDLAIAVVVCVLLITYVVQAFKVQGTSMSPELRDGERILVNKFVYRIGDVDRGDVVVFWYPEDPELSFIKRVVGLPGETIEVRNGDVFLDGVRLDESYVLAENADRRSFAKQEIRPGHFFVLGDNRRGSNDSRSWGLVPERYIYGQAFVRIWPIGDVGFVR